MFHEAQRSICLLVCFWYGSWMAPSQVECGNMVRFFGTEGTWTSLKTARDFGDIFHAKHHTLQGTNISHQKSLLKMIFLFPRWDMLIPWRVVLLCSVSTNFKAKGPFDLDWCWLPISPRPSIYDPCSTLIFLDSDHFQWNSLWLNKIWSIYIYIYISLKFHSMEVLPYFDSWPVIYCRYVWYMLIISSFLPIQYERLDVRVLKTIVHKEQYYIM